MAQPIVGENGVKLSQAMKTAAGGKAGETRAKSPAAKAEAKAQNPKNPKNPKKATGKGVTIERRYTTRGQDPLDTVTWERRQSVITNPDGSVVFKMEGAEIPSAWSQLATDIVVSKYFRKAGLHGKQASAVSPKRQTPAVEAAQETLL